MIYKFNREWFYTIAKKNKTKDKNEISVYHSRWPEWTVFFELDNG